MKKKKLSDSEFKNYFGSFFQSSKKNKGRKKNGDRRTRYIILGIAAIFIFAFVAYIYSGLPSLEEFENPRPVLASKVYSADGELIGQYFIENRIEADVDSLPQHLIDALIATEDRDFYDHWGVDMPRFAKAMIKNVFSFSLKEGASTITQQLAKNLHSLKSGGENTFETGIRKIREWISAVQIERTFTKKEILELYLNVSYFGRSAYGIESAAKVYFDKKASELTLEEAALFIALLKSPENYDPIRRYENAMFRRNLVLHNMVVTDKLSEEEYDKLKDNPIELASETLSAIKSDAPHFMEYVRQRLSAMADKYGYDLYRDGLNIYTTLNMKMQKIANESVKKHLETYQELFDKNWNWERRKSLLTEIVDKSIRNDLRYKKAEGDDEKARVYNMLKSSTEFLDSVKRTATTVESGFVVIDPKTGHIKSLVGGQNMKFGRGLNHVTGIIRQPGSSFKPFVYATAIENGYSPSFTLLNQKFNYNGWSPDNANHEYSGYETLRWGLTHSVNVIAGRLTISEVAPPNQVVKIANRMGIKSKLDPYPAIALGTMEVSPLEMTSAFGTFINDGVHVEPIAILKIEDRNGVLIDQFVPEYVQAISPETAGIMVDMLKDVVNFGTGAGVRRYFQYPAAGKTGTTQKYSDAWFLGFTPHFVAGVWVGFDDHRVKFTNWYGQGAKAALPIWAMFMEGTYKELEIPLKYFELPSSVTTVTLCKETLEYGDPKLATQHCPETVTDMISSDQMPPYCNIHSSSGGTIIHENSKGDSDW